MIELNNISKQYGDTIVLDDVSLSVEHGQIYGIIGRSGAGKSTLIRCTNMLEAPTSGTVMVDEQDLTALPTRELRQARSKMGMIFQHFNLLSSRTVFDNIALPLELAGASKQEIRDAVEPLLELTGLSDRRSHYSSELSGGQKQRVAIARALVTQPKLLLCDEATSSLDPETTSSILTLIRKINLALGITVLLITHEMDVIKEICDKVALMEAGQLIEEGDVGEFFLRPKTEIAKRFVKTALKVDLPDLYKDTLNLSNVVSSEAVLRIIFHGDVTKQAIINELITRFGLTINILQANIEQVGYVMLGIMIIQVSADNGRMLKAKQYLRENHIDVEVLGYVN